MTWGTHLSLGQTFLLPVLHAHRHIPKDPWEDPHPSEGGRSRTSMTREGGVRVHRREPEQVVRVASAGGREGGAIH
jgi:hypothetical protein